MSSEEDKDDNGGIESYSCDTCDRGFKGEEDLKLHLSEHIKCNAGNCDFEAHPKIIALHKKMQHDTGYAHAINNLKDAEEIAKWRAERKRRFPTAENIRKRKAEQAEKEARGEVVETKDFGKMKRPRMENRFNKRHNRSDRRNNRFNNTNLHFRNEKLLATPKAIPSVTLDSDSDDDSHIKLSRFPGMTYLKENPEVQKPKVVSNSEEIDFDKTTQNELDSPKISLLENNEEKGIFQQINIVGSDDEAPVEIPVNKTSPVQDVFSANEVVISDETPVEIPVNETIPVHDVFSAKEDSDDEPPTVLSIEKSVEIELLENKESDTHEIIDGSDVEPPTKKSRAEEPFNTKSRDKHSDKHSMDNVAKPFKRPFDRNRNKFSEQRNRHHEVEPNAVRKSTLLEKLLADDIRHERNFIMQCIRHIVTNNFFDGA